MASSADLDFDRIRHADLPPVLHENDRTIVMVDARRYREMTSEQKKHYREAVAEQINKSDMNATEKSQALSEFGDVFAQLNRGDHVETMAHFSGHNWNGPITHHLRVVVLDDIKPELGPFGLISPNRRPSGSEKMGSEFTMRHEYMHAAYDLKDANEPGAEYMAAVETLVVHRDPQTRAQIQMISDYRTINYMLGGDTNRIMYGAESGQAGMDALKLSNAELDRLAAMKPEQRRQELFKHAQELHDNLTDSNYHRAGVQARVKEDIQNLSNFDVEQALSDPQKLHKLTITVHGLLRAHRYQAGSPEDVALQKFSDAIDRIDKVNNPTAAKTLRVSNSPPADFTA